MDKTDKEVQGFMKNKRFTHTKIVDFNYCKDCPHNYFYGHDLDYDIYCDYDERRNEQRRKTIS